MASLYFYYSAMNAGKTTHLLQASYNYKERKMKTLLFHKSIYDKYIEARIGIKEEGISFNDNFNFYNYIDTIKIKPNIIFIDEAQFLLKKQVLELAKIVDYFNIPVMCYGLRTDFIGNLFEGSAMLLAIADNLKEIKTICFCGKKATMTSRVSNGKTATQGNQVNIEKSIYISYCRKHHNEKLLKYKKK